MSTRLNDVDSGSVSAEHKPPWASSWGSRTRVRGASVPSGPGGAPRPGSSTLSSPWFPVMRMEPSRV